MCGYSRKNEGQIAEYARKRLKEDEMGKQLKVHGGVLVLVESRPLGSKGGRSGRRRPGADAAR